MIKLTEDELNAALRTHEILSDTGSVDMRMTPEHKALDRRQKFNAQPVTVDDLKFDSKAEAKRYQELQIMERAGEISELSVQPKYVLFESFTDNYGRKHRESSYIGDFAYNENGQAVCEDVKGFSTPIYRLKVKLAIMKYPKVYFVEVKNAH